MELRLLLGVSTVTLTLASQRFEQGVPGTSGGYLWWAAFGIQAEKCLVRSRGARTRLKIQSLPVLKLWISWFINKKKCEKEKRGKNEDLPGGTLQGQRRECMDRQNLTAGS